MSKEQVIVLTIVALLGYGTALIVTAVRLAQRRRKMAAKEVFELEHHAYVMVSPESVPMFWTAHDTQLGCFNQFKGLAWTPNTPEEAKEAGFRMAKLRSFASFVEEWPK